MGLFDRKRAKEASKSFPEARRRDIERRDAMFARLRHAEGRIGQLERECSTLRRDVNRVDRKLYTKEAAPIPLPLVEPKPDNGQSVLLFTDQGVK